MFTEAAPQPMDEDVKPVINNDDSNFDEVETLFLSYARTFKKLSPKLQTMLKLDLAKIFARYEMKNALDIDNLMKQVALKRMKKMKNKSNVRSVHSQGMKNNSGNKPKPLSEPQYTPPQNVVNMNSTSNRLSKPIVEFKVTSRQNVYPCTPTLFQDKPLPKRPYVPLKQNNRIVQPASVLNKQPKLVPKPQVVPQMNAFIIDPTSMPTLTPKPVPNLSNKSTDTTFATHIKLPTPTGELKTNPNFKVVKLVKTKDVPKSILQMTRAVGSSAKILNANIKAPIKGSESAVSVSSSNTSQPATPSKYSDDPLFISAESEAEHTVGSIATSLKPNLGPTQITLSDGTILEGIVLESSDLGQEIVISNEMS